MAAKGFIFDLDGVLVDTVPAHFAAWKRMFSEEGYEFDDQIYHEKVDGKLRQDGVAAVMVDADPDRIRAAGNRKNDYFLELIGEGNFRVFEGSAAFVRLAYDAGIRLATASSSVNVRMILAKAGLEQMFAAIVGGDQVSVGKPDPAIFQLAAKLIGLTPAECVVFEDATSGVQAAKAGGFRCIGVDRTGRRDRLAGADRIVADLSELIVRGGTKLHTKI